jgi:acetyl-CoA carboxylase biotin carboxyl carrier protein
MDIKLLKEITKLMKENDLIEVEVEAPELKIKLKKASNQALITTPLVHHHAGAQAHPSAPPAAASTPAETAVDETAHYKQIISPIPGTVYLKPNPDSQNFINIGSTIDESKVVCLIEAMKVFNEIKPDAGMAGTIKKILVKDGQPVEYGTVLFLVG